MTCFSVAFLGPSKFSFAFSGNVGEKKKRKNLKRFNVKKMFDNLIDCLGLQCSNCTKYVGIFFYRCNVLRRTIDKEM